VHDARDLAYKSLRCELNYFTTMTVYFSKAITRLDTKICLFHRSKCSSYVCDWISTKTCYNCC